MKSKTSNSKLFSFPVVQGYPWEQLAHKQKIDWNQTLDSTLDQIVASGYRGWEPSPKNGQDLQRLVEISQKHHLEIKSVYVADHFHDERAEEAKKRVESLLPVLASHEIDILVCNPEPLMGPEKPNKTDVQIGIQTKAFQEMGERCIQHGVRLAYHVHDSEFRAGAREFHHMLLNTSPDSVFFCLDTHWTYRGMGDSMFALEDVIALYGKRVVEVHLRQSRGGIWSEIFEDGDIDYALVVRELLKQNVRPLLVMEQAYEEKTPRTMKPAEANARSLKYLTTVFQPLLGN